MNLCATAHCWHGAIPKCCRCPATRETGLIVMVSNAGGIEVGLLAGRHPGRIGHLYAPGGQRGPYAEIPYALDNGAWPAFLNGEEWDEDAWRALLRWALLSGLMPRWVLVPDVVGNRSATMERWHRYAPGVRAQGFRCAFAVQNGMTFDDVPDDDCMLFIGGDDAFKDASIPTWGARFPGRIHVGRVNGMPRLLAAHAAGAVSVDGTGWFHRGRSSTSSQANDLRKYLRETSAS